MVVYLLTLNIIRGYAYFPSCLLLPVPQDFSSLEIESVMDQGKVSNIPRLFLQLGREIKFNEHFYYVPGALHMLFHLNPQNNPRRCISSHICHEYSKIQRG